jgi:hypothetical protein
MHMEFNNGECALAGLVIAGHGGAHFTLTRRRASVALEEIQMS